MQTMDLMYFAYGSNMSSPRLQARIPAQLHGRARLPRHRLAFHKVGQDGSGKCDVVADDRADAIVHGVLFRLDPEQKYILDRFEGLGRGYDEKTAEVITDTNERITALFYIATHVDPLIQPYHWYKHHVLSGAREHGLPAGYIRKIDSVASIGDPLNKRHLGEMSIYS